MGRILVIDDSAEMRAMLQDTLIAAGHEVVQAIDGKEGLRQYRERPADLVITDLFMPNQEGLETIMKLRRFYPDIPIIAISGACAASKPMLTVAHQLGANETLHKPVTAVELLAAVEKVLPSGRVATPG